VLVNTEGTGRVSESDLANIVRDHFPLTPQGIIQHLALRRPIYQATAAYGHFGRDPKHGQFTWEALDKVAELSALLARKAS
jgi:S-adenosylmethionine synthetase